VKGVKDRSAQSMPPAWLKKLTIDISTKIAVEAQHGLIAQVIKDIIFSMRPKDPSVVSQVSDVTDMAIG